MFNLELVKSVMTPEYMRSLEEVLARHREDLFYMSDDIHPKFFSSTNETIDIEYEEIKRLQIPYKFDEPSDPYTSQIY